MQLRLMILGLDDWLNSEFATIVDENNDDAIFINDDIDDDTTDLLSHGTNDDNNEFTDRGT